VAEGAGRRKSARIGWFCIARDGRGVSTCGKIGMVGRRMTAVRRLARGLAWAMAALAWLGASLTFAADPPVLKLSQLPPPDVVANASAGQSEYVIGPLDQLTIRIYPDSGLGGDIQVDDGGKIAMPLIGEVAAAGKTPGQLGQEISTRLAAKYFESPSVAVMVKSSATQKYTVTGQVSKPGVFDLLGQTTLMQAVATAGGAGDLANMRSVVIFRMIQHKRAAAVVSLADVEKGRVDDPQIYAGDVILVTKSSGKELFTTILKASPLFILLTPLGL